MATRSIFVFLVLAGGLDADLMGIGSASAHQSRTGTNERIVGGKRAELGEFPHQLFMTIKNKTTGMDIFNCGALILNYAWALTAAHCVSDYKFDPEQFTLYAGHLSRSKEETGYEKAYKVEAIHVHPSYGQGKLNDVALMKMKDRFKFSKGVVSPASILDEPESIVGKTAIVSGWGKTDPLDDDSSAASDFLLKTEVDILPSKECEHHVLFDNITHICAGRFGHGMCSGDSGGPLEINRAVVGIVSFTTEAECGMGDPEVYTRVSAYIGWIQDVISSV